MILKRNPNYWRKDTKGNQLPYLDGIEYILPAEASAQVEALRGGQVDYLLYLPSEYVKTVAADPNLVVYQKALQHPLRGPHAQRPQAVRGREGAPGLPGAIDRQAHPGRRLPGPGSQGRDNPVRAGLRRLLPERAGSCRAT